MSKALNSPTARLLRSSRLFSLPPPLPAPSLDTVSSAGFLRSSDTATLPYPTHQAISSPSSSRHRGDWGLKRSLPSRTIPSATPFLRVRQVDNLNHITDFASAADHTQTVAKWQEMNVPMTHRVAQSSISRNENLDRSISAFEEELDHTALGRGVQDTDMSPSRAMQMRNDRTTQLRNKQEERKRWKSQGPWVSGMTEGEFQHYLQTTVRKNRHGFVRFLEDVKVQQKRQQSLQAMRDEGLLSDQDSRAIELDLIRTSTLDEHELNDFIKDLRDNNGQALSLSAELCGLVRDYFDLPPFPTPKVDASKGNMAIADALQTSTPSNASDGPPATHPSAGLSYIRTSAYMENHPLHGPQAKHSPVQARVLQTRGATDRDRAAVLGVAGVVVAGPSMASHSPNRQQNKDRPLTAEEIYAQATTTFDTELPGGNKVWVHPTRAHVDEKGRISLTIQRGDAQAIGVKTGNPVQMPNPDPTASTRMMPLDSASPRFRFGTGLPDYRLPPAKGFAAEEIQKATESKGTEQYQASHIQALLKEHVKESDKK